MEKDKKPNWKKIVIRVLVGWAVVGLVVAVIFLVVQYLSAPAGAPGVTEEKEPEPEPEPTIVSVGGRMMFAGTTYWGRRINQIARASELGVAHPFSGLHTFEREKYTDWITGLECPVMDRGGAHSHYEEFTLLKFYCDPDYLPEAKKWFSIVSLGTNHTNDHGAEGWAETKSWLDSVGIQYFGHHYFRNVYEVCNVVTINVRVTMSNGEVRDGRVPIGMCGWNGVFGIPISESLAKISEFAEIMPVIAMPHMGREYQAGHDSLRQQVYRRMIDNGADMVLGDHPHWVQNTEAYKGRLIVYSMGNFLFDQYGSVEVRRSAVIEAGFEMSGDVTGWMKIADECRGDFAACREAVERENLARYEMKWEYGVKGSYGGNGMTERADEAQEQAIRARLRWDETMLQLGRTD
jgi:poly-gamma-glutamate synthesis protein (capsule biosynthesis protein)